MTTILPMSIEDYDEVIALWRASEGVGLSRADERPAIERFLQRNPGLCFVARDSGRLVGAVICGTDGRRGYLHHMAVASESRRQGVGGRLAEACLSALRAQDIDKCHLFVFAANRSAREFWARIGWKERVELVIMSHDVL